MSLITLFLPSPALAKEMPGARDLLEQQIKELDREIARRMLRRPDTATEKKPRLDMEIDLRIVARWFFAHAAVQKEANDRQVVGRLRGQLALEAAAGVEDLLNRQREKLTLGQVDGISRLHELTFKLPDPKGAASLDDLSRQLAGAILMIAGPGMPDPRLLPPMRPALPPPSPQAQQPPGDIAGVPAIADRIPALNVAVPLRQQLTVLAAAALSGKEKDPETVAKTLASAFELAAALQNNVAVAPDARAHMELQLAEGIALFLDPRTRPAGSTRIADLGEYRRIVERIARLRLSPEQYARYAPLFAWAQREPEGMRALQALEKYIAGRDRAGARASLPSSPVQNLRHSIEDLEKQYRAAHDAFDTAFDELIRTTGSTGAVPLEAPAAEMAQALDLLETLDQTPATLDALAPFKPRPFGGLERRLATAAAAIASGSPQKDESLKFLSDLHRLARLTSALGAVPTSDLSGRIDARYAGGQLSTLESTWKTLASDLASTAAAGGQLDPAKISRLAMARQVYDALRQAAAIESAISAAPTLHKWLDWRLSGEDLATLFQPYQDILSSTVAAYITSAPSTGSSPLEEWTRIEKRYAPLAKVVTRAATLRRSVQPLPDGLVGTAAALLTPCDKAPFAAERRLAFSAAVCRARLAAGDDPSASEVLDLLLKRMNDE